MAEYLSLQEAAEKWGVSARRINQYCVQGRIPGAQKIANAWAIPAEAQKPADPRRKPKESVAVPVPKVPRQLDLSNLMPLTNTCFLPGHCREAALAMSPGPKQDIALAEYYYFSAQPEAAAKMVEPYLNSPEMGARLSACFIYAYSNLPMGRTEHTRLALEQLNTYLSSAQNQSPNLQAALAFIASAGATLLHLPLSEEMPESKDFLLLLPMGVRAFALYVQAHYLYLKKEYAHSAGIVDAALAMGAANYPIPSIYLHLAAVMDYINLKQPQLAERHLLAAWDLARPDDLIEGFGEHHGLLGAMLEAVIKPNWPKDFKRIIDITYRFSAGWRRIHNPVTGHDVADDLTTTEFSIAMLAARGWTTQEIATHLNISVNTVKIHISEAMRKLNVDNRKELKKYMLQ